MFIIPLSLFLIATYLRPRTQAELSYLITAVECLSGLWCLLFAPFQIQLTLLGFLLVRNRTHLKHLITRPSVQDSDYLDLSESASPTIDIEAVGIDIPLISAAALSPTTDHHPSFGVGTHGSWISLPPTADQRHQTFSWTGVKAIASPHLQQYQTYIAPLCLDHQKDQRSPLQRWYSLPPASRPSKEKRHFVELSF